MNKLVRIFLIFIVSVLVILIATFITVRAIGDKILCKYADSLYEKKDYSYAYSLYDVISLYRPHNEEYKYKLTKTLTKMPLTYSVQKKLLQIAQNDDGSDAEKLATRKIKTFRKLIFKKFGNTYIKDAMHDGVVIRWSRSSFPIKYYIEPFSSIPQYYFSETENAFKDWQRETDEFIKFSEVKDEDSADITVKFRPTATGNSSHAHGEYQVAITTPVIEDKSLKKMKIVCSIKPHTNEFFTPQQLKTIMTHEIGHALGIWGHPNDNQSVMYYSLDNPFDYYERRIDTSISYKDVNTIKLLYSFAPNISNNINEVINNEKFIYPPIIFAPLDDVVNMSVGNAEQLLKDHPDDIGYALSLADTYNSAGKYQESIQLMLYLTQKTNNNSLLSTLYYNISNNYINLKDFKKALLYAQKAQSYENSVDNRCLVAYTKFCNGSLESAKKEFTSILKENPGNLSASLGLADVYIKQKNYIEARNTLKELLKHNPNALEDKALNSYKLYTIF